MFFIFSYRCQLLHIWRSVNTQPLSTSTRTLQNRTCFNGMAERPRIELRLPVKVGRISNPLGYHYPTAPSCRLFRLSRLVFMVAISVEMSRYSGDGLRCRSPYHPWYQPISSRCCEPSQLTRHIVILLPMLSCGIFVFRLVCI